MECIVLAGGLGTRLKNSIGELPKCMAPINNKPFLFYLLQYLEKQQCNKVILALGYAHQVVLEWLNNQSFNLTIDYVVEQEPLGTGGGLKLALSRCNSQFPIVLNGDTIFNVNLAKFYEFHLKHNAGVSIALKPMENFERYGNVDIDESQSIIAFQEKQKTEKGLINGGVYVLDKDYFTAKKLPEKCSLEKDFLEHFLSDNKYFGAVFEDYFIDIGIPEDYSKAQIDFINLFS